jgi:hypothetical protein
MILLLWRGGRFLFNESRDVLQAEAWGDYSGGRSIPAYKGLADRYDIMNPAEPHRLMTARPPPQSPGVAPLLVAPLREMAGEGGRGFSHAQASARRRSANSS